jgi:hypothetical protein
MFQSQDVAAAANAESIIVRGYKFTLGNENFYPRCGVNIQQQKVAAVASSRRGDDNNPSIKISSIKDLGRCNELPTLIKSDAYSDEINI